MKGKAYANCKPKNERPKGDFYSTPKSLVWVAEDIIKSEFKDNIIIDPAMGIGAILEALAEIRHSACDVGSDLYFGKTKIDYLHPGRYKVFINTSYYVITNPPFSLWDEFVMKAKTHCKKFMFIGRLNYFGTQSRLESGIFNNLKAVYPFSRYVDYRTPYRIDGLFHVGAMATAWFLWDMEFKGYPIIKQLDVQKYATLGGYKENDPL